MILALSAAAALGIAGLVAAQGHGGPCGPMGHGRGGSPLEHLSRVLGLTDAQKTQIQPIVDAAKPQFHAIHQDAHAKVKALMAETITKVTPYLTPDQQQELVVIRRHMDRRVAARDAAAKDGQPPERWGHGRHGGPGGMGGDPLAHFARAFGLSEAQQAQVKPIFDAAAPQMKAIRDDVHAKMKSVMQDTISKIKPALTAAQLEQLSTLQQKMEQMRAARGAGKDV